jgi:hypothetical protein
MQAQVHTITAIKLSNNLRQYFEGRHGDRFSDHVHALPISWRELLSLTTIPLKATIFSSLTHFYVTEGAERNVKVRRQIKGRWIVCGRNRKTA